MKVLNKAKSVKVSADIVRVTRSGARRAATARIHNHGSAVAAMVRLSLLDSRSNDRVLPTLYSDNYLWGRPALRVEGYNVPQTVARS